MEIKTYPEEVEYTNKINGENNVLNVENSTDGTYNINLCENTNGLDAQLSISNVNSDQLLSWCNLYILSEKQGEVVKLTIEDTEFTETTSTIVVDSEDMSEFCQRVIEHFNL